mmetsp:Transcript_40341/g.72196  ORF Transcript_40341/g.72196 Transcript_40341/m.72196 type:complete len:578 (-) Transcript_40341:49-1782(-)
MRVWSLVVFATAASSCAGASLENTFRAREVCEDQQISLARSDVSSASSSRIARCSQETDQDSFDQDSLLFLQILKEVDFQSGPVIAHHGGESLKIAFAAAMILFVIYAASCCTERPSCKSDVYGAYVGSSAILQNMFLTFLLPESLHLAEQLGLGTGFAGSVAALAFLGTSIGSFLSQSRQTDFADCTTTVNVLTFGVLVSAAVFGWAAFESDLEQSARSKSRDVALLLLSRTMGGVLVGIFYVSSHPIFLDLGGPTERFQRASRITVYFLTGLGVGPMLVPVATRLAPRLAAASSLLVTFMFVWHFCVGLMLSFCDVAELRSSSESDGSTNSGNSALPDNFLRIMLGSLMVEATRCFVTGGLEIGNATVLEALMGWDAEQTGAVIGIPIIMTPVILWLINGLHEVFPTTTLVRILLLQSLLGCVAIFNFHVGFEGFVLGRAPASASFGSSSAGQGLLFLFGICIIFPSATAAEALVMGIMFHHAAPVGKSTFDVRGCAFWATLIGSVSKFFGQLVTPTIIAVGGQNLFGVMQVTLVLVFLAISETMLHAAGMSPEPSDIANTSPGKSQQENAKMKD